MSDILTTREVEFAYPGGKPVLRGVSLTLRAGEVVALIGPNGSGKSTLIKALLGAVTAKGHINWSDKPLQAWRRRDLAGVVAYLAQSPAFDPDQTVADVLRLGRAARWGAFGIESVEDVRRVNDVAAQLQLTDLLARPVSDLSGGQRQRVFVGRCLVQEPLAMLLDEPNTYLDLRHQVELGQLITSLSRERQMGILMASHDLNLAGMFADRLILLSEGRVVAEGNAATVLEPQLLQQVYGVAMERVERGGKPLVFPRNDKRL